MWNSFSFVPFGILQIRIHFYPLSFFSSMMSDYEVQMEEDSLSAFFVKMKGPKDSKFVSSVF
jgi:hypothetical protein